VRPRTRPRQERKHRMEQQTKPANDRHRLLGGVPVRSHADRQVIRATARSRLGGLRRDRAAPEGAWRLPSHARLLRLHDQEAHEPRRRQGRARSRGRLRPPIVVRLRRGLSTRSTQQTSACYLRTTALRAAFSRGRQRPQ
jgi:hypothetical protein